MLIKVRLDQISHIDEHQTCDKDAEFKQGTVIDFVKVWPEFFLIHINCDTGRICGVEYEPVEEDHEGLAIEKNVEEFMTVFGAVAYNIEISGELGNIGIMKATWM